MPFSRTKYFLILLLSTFSFNVVAQEVFIFEVKSNLRMSDDEPAYKDYLINAGSEAGLQPGVVVTVKRTTAMYNSYQNKSAGELVVPVGEVKIIHVQRGMSVARLSSLARHNNIPVVDYEDIMAGDQIDVSSAHREEKGKKTAETEASAVTVAKLTEAEIPKASPPPVKLESTPQPQANPAPTAPGAASAPDSKGAAVTNPQ